MYMLLIFPLCYVSHKKDTCSKEFIDVIRRRDEAPCHTHEYIFIIQHNLHRTLTNVAALDLQIQMEQ